MLDLFYGKTMKCSFFSLVLLVFTVSTHAATVTTNYTYDNIGRLTTTSYTTAAGASSISYNYDAAGNMLASTSTLPAGGTTTPLSGSIAAGARFTVALQSNGSVVAWGDNQYFQSMVPFGLKGVTAVAAGDQHAVAVKSDGTVVAWGDNARGQATVPAGLTGVTSVAANGFYTLALKNNGTVVAWGRGVYGQTSVPVGLTGVTAIAAGGNHAVALKSGGTVVAWGDNTYGQATIPAGLTGVIAIAAGWFHSVALKSDGTVIVWGDNTYGQSTIPIGLTGVTAIAAGSNYTLALKSDGTLVAWGSWGNNSLAQMSVPAGLTGVAAIGAGLYHAVAIKSDGTVVEWNDSGTSGTGAQLWRSTVPRPYPVGLVLTNNNQPPAPTAPGIATSISIGAKTKISVNDPNIKDTYSFSIISGPLKGSANVDSNGLVSYWPKNILSGTDSFTVMVTDQGGLSGAVTVNVVIDPADRVSPVVTPPASIIIPATSTAGVQLTNPAIVSFLNGTTATDNVAVVGSITNDAPTVFPVQGGALPTERTTVVTFSASDAAGNTGTATANVTVTAYIAPDTTKPVITLLGNASIQVVKGTSYSDAGATASDNVDGNITSLIVVNNTVNTAAVGSYTVTYDVSDKAGNAAVRVVRTVNVIAPYPSIIHQPIAAGASHTIAVRSDGTVVAWGFNGWGQTTVPVGLSGVTAVAAGNNHSVALKSDGTVVAWGDNSSGQTTIPAGLTGVTAIAAGGNHTLALKADGTVVAWGKNWNGTIDAPITVPAGLTGVIAVSTGSNFSLALISDGTVVAWGYNSWGQTIVPVGLAGVTAIAAGGAHAVALKSDGSVVTWGWNGYGQSTIPTGLTGITGIAAGSRHTVALKADGTVVAWGDTLWGQSTVPTGLSGVLAIAAGQYYTVALKSDGTVAGWGDNSAGQSTLPAGVNLIVPPALNQPPAPTAPAITTAAGASGTSQIAANDPNAGDTHTYAVSTQAVSGSASVNATGLATYTPNTGFTGTDSFTVTVTDNGSPQKSGTVTIKVMVKTTSAKAAPPLMGLSIGDITGNGSADMAVLGKRASTGRYVIRVKDTGTVPALIREIPLSGTFQPIQMVKLADMNANGSPEIAVLEVDPAMGKNGQIQVKDSRTGALIRNIHIKSTVKPHMLVALPDVNGNGSADLALSEVDPVTGKNVQIQVKDGKTGAKIANIRVNTAVKPYQLIALVSVNGAPAVALSEVDPVTGKNVQIQVKRASNGALIKNVRVNTTTKPHMLVALPDVNGNGSTDVAFSEVNATTGKNVQVQVKDAATGAKISNIALNPNYKPHQLIALGDVNGNGSADIALSEMGAIGGKSKQIQVKDGRTGAKISNIHVNGNTKPYQLIALGNVNGVGSPADLALLEVNPATGKNVQIQVKDALTGALIKNIRLNPNYSPLGMVSAPDSNGNGVQELGVLEQDATGKVQVQVKDALTGTLIRNQPFPNF